LQSLLLSGDNLEKMQEGKEAISNSIGEDTRMLPDSPFPFTY